MKKTLTILTLLLSGISLFAQTRSSIIINQKTLDISCFKKYDDSITLSLSYSYLVLDQYGQPMYEYQDDIMSMTAEEIINSMTTGEKKQIRVQKHNRYNLYINERLFDSFVNELKMVEDYFNRWYNTAIENGIKDMQKEIPVKFSIVTKEQAKYYKEYGATFIVKDYKPYCNLHLPDLGILYFYQGDFVVLVNAIEQTIKDYNDLENKKENLFK